MGRKELKQNGGYRMDNTAIIIVWKMKADAATGCSEPGIMMSLILINGLFMDFLRKI